MDIGTGMVVVAYYAGKVWRFVRRYWYVFAGVIGAVLSLVFLKRRPVGLVEEVFDRLEAAREEQWIERLSAISGRDVALDAIKSRYESEAAALDSKEQARAKELRDNPTELAHLLLTAGRRRIRRS